ncbi:MAG: hypothetical protein U5K54_22565 [Cytophagales bacterium]|nr:hypothetical protein [Cytophagales bacterium]
MDLAAGLTPYSIVIGDLNDNGKPDVVVSNFSSGTISVLGDNSTSGSIAFLPKVDFTSGAGALDVKLYDMIVMENRDAVVANGGSRISILKNAEFFYAHCHWFLVVSTRFYFHVKSVWHCRAGVLMAMANPILLPLIITEVRFPF